MEALGERGRREYLIDLTESDHNGIKDISAGLMKVFYYKKSPVEAKTTRTISMVILL